MNDTNITPRQAYILTIVSQSDGITRQHIQQQIALRYVLSKPTVIRELNSLVKSNHIRIEGSAKNVVYYPVISNPLFRYVNIDSYFDIDPDQRAVRSSVFDFTIFDHLTTLFTTEELKTIARVEKNWSAQIRSLSPDVVKKEIERFTIELSWKSSKIEGNTYSLLDTEMLILKNKKAAGHSDIEATMILNHKKAFEQILKTTADFTVLKLTTFNQLHNVLISNMGITTGIRRQPVGITGTVYQPLENQHQLHEVMERLVDCVNRSKSGLEKALIAYLMIPYIQPYTDGNKRTGRMLANAILLAHDYYPISYRSIDEEEFKKAMIIFYEQQSIYHIKRLFIEQLIFAFTTYFKS